MGQRGTAQGQGSMPPYLNQDYTVNPANIPSLNFRSPMTNIGNRIMNAPFINPDVRTAIGTTPFQNPAYQQGACTLEYHNKAFLRLYPKLHKPSR